MLERAALGVVDPGVAAQHLGLVAVPGLAAGEVSVVAQRLMWGETHIAHRGLRQRAQAEQALEEHPVGPLLPQPLQHSDRLAGVHHRHLHQRRPQPEQREQSRVEAVAVVQHLACHTSAELWRVKSCQEEIATVALGSTVKVVHLHQDLQHVSHVPLPPSLSGEDGEQAVVGVAARGQDHCGGTRRRPGDGVQEVALLQFVLRRRLLAQLAAEGLVGVIFGQIPRNQGRLDSALQPVYG